MMRFLILLAAGVCTAACGRAAADSANRALAWSADTLYAIPELVRTLSDSAARGSDLLRPVFARSDGASVFVADLGSDRIALIDSTGTVARWIGARGRGPGELLGIAHLAVDDGRVYVAEARNGRVSVFSVDGSFVVTYPAPVATGSLAVWRGRIVIATPSRTAFGSLLAAHESPAVALRRPRVRGDRAGQRWAAIPGHDLLAADSAGYWVFDQGMGRVCRYPHPDAKPDCRELPASLLARLRSYRDGRVARLEHGSQRRVMAAPLAKDLLHVGPVLALFLPLPELPIVIVDVDDGTVTPAFHPADTLPGWARRATSLAWTGASFIAISDDAIGRFHLSRNPNAR